MKKNIPVKKERKAFREEEKLLKKFRAGKGLEDDPEEEAAIQVAFEKGDIPDITEKRRAEMRQAAAETLAIIKKMPLLKHKGYLGTYKHDKKAKIFHGEVIGIKDSITFHSAVETDMEQAFHDSIDDYLAFCAKSGHEPDKIDKETWWKSLTTASEDFMQERAQPENQSRASLDPATERPESELNRQIDEYCDHLQKNKKSLKAFNKLSEEDWPK